MASPISNLGPISFARPYTLDPWVISPIPVREKAHFSNLRLLLRNATSDDVKCNDLRISNLHDKRRNTSIPVGAVSLVHRSLTEAEVSVAGTKPSSKFRGIQLVVAIVMLFGVTHALAARHPVPLDPKTDSATCIQCHEDKAKGKAVHSAIAMGCTSCHEVRVNKDVTYVKLITATPYKLCLTCHSDKDATQIQGHVHQPAVRDCLTCHDPHTSENKNQLLKATSGDAKENLCLGCHQTGLNVPDKGSRHAALDMGCETCHTTHKAGDREKPEFAYHLTKSTPQLCIDCHDPKAADLQKAHQGQPFGTADCVQCHDPHQSNAPKLMQAYLHNPFENKMCDTCHQPAKDGKVVLTQADAKSLCVTCHEDKAKLIDSAKVQHPGAAGDCTDCHSPHASKSPGLPKTDPVNICLDCHTDIAELAKKSIHHQPVFGQGCATCHEPHGGERPKLLRAQGNALCLECHGPESQPQKLAAEHLLTIFDGKVKLPEDYYKKNKVVILPLKYGLGHPVDYHPVSDVMDPTNITKVKTPMSCLTCHQPHASAKPGLLVKDQENNMVFCDTCHKNRVTMGAQ
jgi:predicted CXXCH cytochrome family protein